jgi:spore maturation protein B
MMISTISEQIGNILILLFLVGIPLYAFFRKVPVYDAFIEGAKEGFPTFIRIMPFMVAMLVAIGMLRASGAFDLLNQAIAPLLGKIGIPAEIVPIALIRPFSASAATAAAADLLHNSGGNSFISHLAVVVSATTETTFYIVAIYFGAVNIRKNRHAIPASLIVDIVGILSAVWITTYFLR